MKVSVDGRLGERRWAREPLTRGFVGTLEESRAFEHSPIPGVVGDPVELVPRRASRPRPCSRPFARGSVQTCEQARHSVAHNLGGSVRPLRRYMPRHGNHVISHGEKCAAVHGRQRPDDLGNAWHQEGEEFVLPPDAFESGLRVVDDVRAAAYHEMSAGERLEKRVQLDAPVRADVRRGRD
jgi:hypothetical protein